MTNSVDLFVGRRIKELREARGISPADACDALRITAGDFRAKECGLARFSGDEIKGLCRILEIRPSDIYDAVLGEVGLTIDPSVRERLQDCGPQDEASG